MSRSVPYPDYRRPTRAKEPVMALDAQGNNHPDVGTGAASFWHRPTNRYPGCTCPPWRYNPAQPKPTEPTCPKHGAGEPSV